MKWEEIKKCYCEQWIIIEAISAHSEGEKRIIDDMVIVDVFGDMDYGFNINAILGTDFLRRAKAKIDMHI